MSPLLRSTLKEWLAEHPGGDFTFTPGLHVFRSKKDRRNASRSRSTRLITTSETRSPASKWEKLHGWHVFRHSFCSNCAAKGIDQRIINAWVGHLSEDMVRRYAILLPDQNQAAIQSVFA